MIKKENVKKIVKLAFFHFWLPNIKIAKMTNRRYIHFTALLSFCLDVASLTNLRPCVKMKLSLNIHWPVHQDDGKGNCVQQTKKQKGKVFSDICLQSLSVLHNVVLCTVSSTRCSIQAD